MELPHSLEAERAVIGSLIIDPHMVTAVSEYLQPEHFYGDKNRIIYQAILELDNRGDVPDSVSIAEHLRAAKQLKRIGSINYIVGCMEENTGAYLVEQHADIVLENARLRGIIEYAEKIKGLALSGGSSSEVMSDAEHALAGLNVQTGSGLDLTRAYAEEAESILNEQMGGYVQTGFYGIDQMLGGLKGLVILAARPSTGKSSLARDIVRNAARKGFKSALLSPDQSGADIFRLEASLASGVNLTRIKSRQYSIEEATRWRTELHRVRDTMPNSVLVDDRPLTLPSLTARFRNAVRWGANLIVVDYLQLVEVPGLKANEEYSAVTASSKMLKRLARENNVPVLVLAQLSRNVEQRSNPKPIMSDLRSSGQIEQDADSIMFLYRPNRDAPELREPVHCIIDKQKDGPTGTVQLTFHREFSTFYDATPGGFR